MAMNMKERDRLGIGSTVSLQGGEFIPREYHRRILKKIAQLTKVIYTLNTKIDENEDFIANLRAIHEAENRRIIDDSAVKLKSCEEQFTRETEAVQKHVEKLGQALEDIRGERDTLYDKQVAYRKDVEDQLSSLKTQHTTKVQSLVAELKKFHSEQEKQVKQVSDLRAQLSRRAAEDVKALKLQHQEELAGIRQDCETQVQNLQGVIAALKSEHVTEIDSLTKQFRSQLDEQSKSLSSAQEEILSKEKESWEEKQRQQNIAFLEAEEQLKQQISSLSKELRSTSDKLALAEQRVRDLEANCEENKAGSGTLRALLEKSEADIECLRGTVSNLQTDLDIAREKYSQQTVELQATSGTVARLEALRVSNEGLIQSLHSQISSLESKLRMEQEEREGIKSSQLSINENQTAKIKALEKELGRVRGEKQELHAQFAREIEAAHAQLSHRESELEQQHSKVMGEIKEQHSIALANAETEKNISLDSLKLELFTQKDHELQKLHDQHFSEITKLKSQLSDKTSQLEQALQELKSLRDKLTLGEKGLGTATSQLDRLRVDLTQAQSSLLETQRECADVKTENAQLRSNVESLRRQKLEGDSAHSEELRRTRTDLTTELDTVWKERIKRETSSLRTELSQRHSEETRVALAELAGLKDTALKQAQENWDQEKGTLLDKIAGLESELYRLRQSTSASLEEARTTSDSQINNLRRELENEILQHKQLLASLRKSHTDQIQSLHIEHEQDKLTLTAQLKDQYNRELLSIRQANQLAVDALKVKLEVDKRESLSMANGEHSKEMKLLEKRLGLRFEEDLSRVNGEHIAEMERFRQQIDTIFTQSHQQMQTQESIADGLRKEIESRDTELSILRDQSNSLTVAVANLKKELTVREQELQLARREAKRTLRIREQQLIATHHSELEAVNAQHRHKAQQLLTDFNAAKSLLSKKIHELERQLSDWERRYKNRDSKPEDLEAIRELKIIVREQEQKMKDLVAEKRVYQLELMNREKNYNKLFNVNPQVGLLNPLQLKQRKQSPVSSDTHKYASAPSLLAPLSPEPPIHTTPHLTPLPHSLKLAALPSDSGLTSSGTQLSKKPSPSQTLLDAKPKKLVMLKDSPLTQKRKRTESNHKNGPLQPVDTHSQTSVSPQKHTMVVH